VTPFPDDPMRFFRLCARGAALALSLPLLASCGNDAGTGPFSGDLFMRLRVDGTLYEYSLAGGLLGIFGGSGRYNNLSITGNDAGATSVTIMVWDTLAVSARTYDDFRTTVPAGSFGAIINFTDPSGADYDSGDAGTDANVTITAITSNQITGTFTGILAATGKPNVTVTEGSFRVARFN